MKYKLVYHLIFVLLLGCTTKTKNNEERYLKIDDFFSDYSEGPGAAIGVVKEGELIYSKGFGYANLDYQIPITSDSKFYIGSMAKQFCGAALLKLQSEGKLDFNNPIQNYLSDFPFYNDTITVNHIIHHTSGIRGTSSMQLIAGIKSDFEDFFTAEQQYEMIKSQEQLNFPPGQEFRYSSGGYIVLAKLIEKISGKSFRTYLKQNIFEPLGMSNTFVLDNHREILKDRVISYFPSGEGFERRSLIFDGKGDGSIVTTINDLVKWDRSFYDDSRLGIPNFATRMYETDKVLRGNSQHYGMALQTSKYKGLLRVDHNGGMLGFRADLIRFPEKNLSVIVLANHANINSSYEALKIADLFLESQNESISNKNSVIRKYESIDTEKAQELIGKYFSHDINMWKRISYENDTLFYDSGNKQYRTPLRMIDENEFSIDVFNPPVHLRFIDDMIHLDYGWVSYGFNKFNDALPEWDELIPYIGTYYSKELRTYYEIFDENEKLFVRINNNSPFEIYPKPVDNRINWNSKSMVWLGYAMMKFQFHKDNSVSGFEIGDNRVKGISFEKIE